MTRIAAVLISGISLIASQLADAIMDKNSNGVSDLWETSYNNGVLFPSNYDLQDDPDGDGWNNAQEAQAGTNPNDPNPPTGFVRVEITDIPATYTNVSGTNQLATPETMRLRWPTIIGKKYSLFFSPDLTTWIYVDELVGNGTVRGNCIPITQPDGSTPDAMFWRVKVSDIDSDSDSLTDSEENQLGTNLLNADSDGDGLPDAWEVAHGLDPMDDGTLDPENGLLGDPDLDELVNGDEYYFGGDPYEQDTDADGLQDYDEAWVYSTLLDNSDTDGDGVSDGLEVNTYLTDPHYADTDGDSLSDGQEINQFHTNPLAIDTDGDGLRDDWEITHGFNPLVFNIAADPDGDGLQNIAEQLLGLDPADSDSDNDGILDGNEDPDKDGLTNSAEIYVHFTNPLRADTDADGMPDGWEIAHVLNPLSAAGNDGTAGDPDGDGLTNYQEWLNDSNPLDADTDDDGTNDGLEVAQGSDPKKAGDAGAAPPAGSLIEVPFEVGDSSASYSEKWKMTIKGLGPDDHRTMGLASPGFGEMATDTLKLRKWNSYEVSVDHDGTDPEYLEENDDMPDYDWEATADHQPSGTSEAHTESQSGLYNFFMVKNHWLVDNRQPVLTQLKHGNDTDLVSGKKAYFIPVDIDDNSFATGADDVSITSDDPAVRGYQDKFWIMAPCGAEDIGDRMRFNTPINPSADLKIESDLCTTDPETTSLGSSDPLPIVEWKGDGTVTVEDTPIWKLGPDAETISLPVRVKVMKKRTIKVAIFPIKDPQTTRAVPRPTEALLTERFNQAFGNQLNLWFEVSYKPKADGTDHLYDYDTDGDGYALTDGEWLNDMRDDPAFAAGDADIRVFLIDGVFVRPDAGGISNAELEIGGRSIGANAVLANAGDPTNARPVDALINTLCHEIGHVMIGVGHPDDFNIEVTLGLGSGTSGVAPLPGTDRSKRLMSSPSTRAENATLLVKTEWDTAEAWLIQNIDDNN